MQSSTSSSATTNNSQQRLLHRQQLSLDSLMYAHQTYPGNFVVAAWLVWWWLLGDVPLFSCMRFANHISSFLLQIFVDLFLPFAVIPTHVHSSEHTHYFSHLIQNHLLIKKVFFCSFFFSSSCLSFPSGMFFFFPLNCVIHCMKATICYFC